MRRPVTSTRGPPPCSCLRARPRGSCSLGHRCAHICMSCASPCSCARLHTHPQTPHHTTPHHTSDAHPTTPHPPSPHRINTHMASIPASRRRQPPLSHWLGARERQAAESSCRGRRASTAELPPSSHGWALENGKQQDGASLPAEVAAGMLRSMSPTTPYHHRLLPAHEPRLGAGARGQAGGRQAAAAAGVWCEGFLFSQICT